MAKQQDDAFDVLTFYIYVMALLTAIVGGFALWNKKKVDAEAMKVRGELLKLDSMKKMAIDEDLRGWIAREREGRHRLLARKPHLSPSVPCRYAPSSASYGAAPEHP